MDKDLIELVYAEKYKTYYRPIKFENGICEVIRVNDRKKNKVNKNHITDFFTDTDWVFKIMFNQYVAAEAEFIHAINCAGEYSRKENNINHFIENGLQDSALAMHALKRLASEKTKGLEGKELHIVHRAQHILNRLITEPIKKGNHKTYMQHIPRDTRDLAAIKNLIIERNDEFIYDDGVRRHTTSFERKKIHQKSKCGFLIRNSRGEVIAGTGHTLTDKQVIKFIDNYENNFVEDINGSYQVQMSPAHKKAYQECQVFLRKNGYTWTNKNNNTFSIYDKDLCILEDVCFLTFRDFIEKELKDANKTQNKKRNKAC